ncbi:hypothetical protein H4J02_11295 [Protaetiibacter sp. SSC-01]|uniref:hypothetical protein n=1 Tax=Protaetiibacter sp. SSC-01 TaxID=2759943 RepID=UPI00165703C1|nr:hypothetical protein [Protaetiibacter sp. SSC-01]QNO37038.1 hypothetical protein H4J02_11295 [Protaetiibacter sp. SSC-01]
MRTGKRIGKWLIGGLAVALVVGLFPPQTQRAEAADASLFNPGYLISDAAFYNGSDMTVDAIQAFLDQKGAACGGSLCLKNYAVTTVAKSPDRYCSGYGAVWHTAAQIIEGVQRSCGISARVLLVLLEKEQSLVTTTVPTTGRYRSATGYGCPDTAPCDAQFYGFFNQVYQAARQFKIYQATPTSWNYQAGRWNTIKWHPNSACGAGSVYIQNQATAGLYIYTPYQPNAAALGNLYGTGDGCSSYGNRNFWRLWSDWFGTIEGYSVSGAIGEYWVAKGGATNAALGAPTSNQFLVDRARWSWMQNFENGQVYWSSQTGARTASGGIGIYYTNRGGPHGTGLGYPTSEQRLFDDAAYGWVQDFENGRIYWTPALGSVPVRGGISTTYERMGGPLGSGLGYPVDPEYSVGGGTIQEFQIGRLYYSSAGGGRLVPGKLGDAYELAGGPVGSGLGYPTADQVAGPRGGAIQQFQNGRLYWSESTGAWQVPGGIGIDYAAWGGPTVASLGYPAGAQRQISSWGWMQPFENGAVYWSGASRIVTGGIRIAYEAAGGPLGSGLGYPTADAVTSGAVTTQQFEYGTIRWENGTATTTISDPTRASHYANGGPQGSLGAKVGGRTSIGGAGNGWYDSYVNGRIYGADGLAPQRVSGGIGEKYTAAGGPLGSGLGYPIGQQFQLGDSAGGWMQRFQSGAIYWAPGTGAVVVTGEIAQAYDRNGGPTADPLRYPTAGATNIANGVSQKFQNGTMYWSSQTGAWGVPGGIGLDYARWGATGSSLGFPTSGQYQPTSAGWVQRFQNGSIYWSGSTGSQIVTGPLGEAYEAAGGPASTVGYPTAPVGDTPGGLYQSFSGGRIYMQDGQPAYLVPGGIGQLYVARGGRSGSGLGFPVGPQYELSDGGWVQAFQSGRIYWSGLGGYFVSGGIGDYYLKVGGPVGSEIGYPRGWQTATGGGDFVQYFQSGRIEWRAGVGAVLVR